MPINPTPDRGWYYAQPAPDSPTTNPPDESSGGTTTQFWGPIIGGLIGGGLGLIGDSISGGQQAGAVRDANSANMAMNREALNFAREMSRMGIRWRVEDAEKAGLHPAAALGMGPVGSVPQLIGMDPVDSQNSVGKALSRMGQNLERAKFATKTERERVNRIGELEIKERELKTDILQTQLNQLKQVGPGLPDYNQKNIVPGQGNARGASGVEPTMPWKEPGYVPDISYSRTAQGGLAPVLSEQIADRGGEDNISVQLDWALRNQIAPRMWPKLTIKNRPDTRVFPIPKELRKRGYVDWAYDQKLGQFMPSKKSWGRSLKLDEIKRMLSGPKKHWKFRNIKGSLKKKRP